MATKEEILAELEHTKLPCVRITPEPDEIPGPTDSKFGGDYYLPAGAEAPEMEFLAQINFAQVPALEGFPGKGLLQFFLCTEDEKFEDFIGDRLAFFPDSGFFQVRWYPEVLAGGSAHPDIVPKERWAMEKITGSMRFEPTEETASISADDEGRFVADLGYQEAVVNMDTFLGDEEGYDLGDCGGVNDFFWDFGNWGIKLGGHPSLRYTDIRLNDRSFQDYTVLLFQLDLTALPSAEAEADTFCFFIKPEDLKACRFDDILLTWHNCY